MDCVPVCAYRIDLIGTCGCVSFLLSRVRSGAAAALAINPGTWLTEELPEDGFGTTVEGSAAGPIGSLCACLVCLALAAW